MDHSAAFCFIPKREETSPIYQQILANLGHDGWIIEHSGSGWDTARKENRGLLFQVYLPGQPLSSPPTHPQVQKWEAFLFCPQGLRSGDLEQSVLHAIQTWFIDLQTGHVFPYPPHPKQKTWDWLLAYINLNPQPPSEERTLPNEPNAVPSESSQEVTFRPYITLILAALNVAVFVLMTLAGGSTNAQVLIRFGAKVNELILQGQVWRFFTSMFIHIGFFHLAFNLYALWILGSFCEERFGHRRYLFTYLLSGLAGSVASFLFTDALSAGASGAIFGLLGALVPYAWKQPHIWKSGLGKNLIIIIVINLGLGLIQPQIDIYAHLGGLLLGMVLGFLFP